MLSLWVQLLDTEVAASPHIANMVTESLLRGLRVLGAQWVRVKEPLTSVGIPVDVVVPPTEPFRACPGTGVIPDDFVNECVGTKELVKHRLHQVADTPVD